MGCACILSLVWNRTQLEQFGEVTIELGDLSVGTQKFEPLLLNSWVGYPHKEIANDSVMTSVTSSM